MTSSLHAAPAPTANRLPVAGEDQAWCPGALKFWKGTGCACCCEFRIAATILKLSDGLQGWIERLTAAQKPKGVANNEWILVTKSCWGG